MIKTLRSSIFAGIFIGTAGFGFLASGLQGQYGTLAGAILFSLGLMAVVGYKLKLYTGTAGFIKKNEVGTLFLILLGNIIGCLCMGLLTRVSPIAHPETGRTIQDAAQGIAALRLKTGAVNCGLLGIGCGLLMTTAVTLPVRRTSFLFFSQCRSSLSADSRTVLRMHSTTLRCRSSSGLLNCSESMCAQFLVTSSAATFTESFCQPNSDQKCSVI